MSAIQQVLIAIGSSVPGAPTGVAANYASYTSATVAFTAPASNGGSAITQYTAISTPDSLTGTVNQAGSGTITVTGLTGNTAYTFTVHATNSVGNSAESSASASKTCINWYISSGNLLYTDGDYHCVVYTSSGTFSLERETTTASYINISNNADNQSYNQFSGSTGGNGGGTGASYGSFTGKTITVGSKTVTVATPTTFNGDSTNTGGGAGSGHSAAYGTNGYDAVGGFTSSLTGTSTWYCCSGADGGGGGDDTADPPDPAGAGGGSPGAGAGSFAGGAGSDVTAGLGTAGGAAGGYGNGGNAGGGCGPSASGHATNGAHSAGACLIRYRFQS